MASVWMLNVGKQQAPNINFWFWYVQCTLKDRIDSHYGRQTDHKTELVLKFRTWIFLAQRHFHLWPRPKNSISNFQSVLFQLAPANHFFGKQTIRNEEMETPLNCRYWWLSVINLLQIYTNWRELKWVVLCFPMVMLILLVYQWESAVVEGGSGSSGSQAAVPQQHCHMVKLGRASCWSKRVEAYIN